MEMRKNKKVILAIKIGLFVNLFLAIIKLTFGYLGNAQALISDGFNSFSDIFISVLLLSMLRIASKKPDANHPYGHEKFEGIAYLVLGIIFIFTALYIEISGIVLLIRFFNYTEDPIVPNIFTLYVSIFSLILKLSLFYYYFVVSKKFNSPSLKADSKNHLIDVFATLVSLIGITLSQLNFVIFDYISSMIIGGFILKLALSVIKESIAYLVDQAPSKEIVDSIYEFINSIHGVIKIDDLKIRSHMTKIYIDVEISVNSQLSLKKAHEIAENVHNQVETRYKQVLHCMVHVNPSE